MTPPSKLTKAGPKINATTPLKRPDAVLEKNSTEPHTIRQGLLNEVSGSTILRAKAKSVTPAKWNPPPVIVFENIP